MNLKEKSIFYWEDKMNDLLPKQGVTDMTPAKHKEELKHSYSSKLHVVRSMPLSWFEKFEVLANIYKTAVCCGGHAKSSNNFRLFDEEKTKLGCEVPSNDILLSFGTFNGKGSF